jgi:hypothetical protein
LISRGGGGEVEDIDVTAPGDKLVFVVAKVNPAAFDTAACVSSVTDAVARDVNFAPEGDDAWIDGDDAGSSLQPTGGDTITGMIRGFTGAGCGVGGYPHPNYPPIFKGTGWGVNDPNDDVGSKADNTAYRFAGDPFAIGGLADFDAIFVPNTNAAAQYAGYAFTENGPLIQFKLVRSLEKGLEGNLFIFNAKIFGDTNNLDCIA